MASEYIVLYDSLGYLVTDEDDRTFPARAARGDVVELDEKQAKRYLALGAVRPKGEEPEEGDEEFLTAGQVASYSPREVLGYVDTHPESREAVIKHERAGKNRPGLLQALESPGHLPAEPDPTGETVDDRLAAALGDGDEATVAVANELDELGVTRRGNSSWYELSNGETVQGREAALRAARQLKAEEEQATPEQAGGDGG